MCISVHKLDFFTSLCCVPKYFERDRFFKLNINAQKASHMWCLFLCRRRWDFDKVKEIQAYEIQGEGQLL
nr:MAG TPA: hypothetical protein [Caudoviricetes sp.]